MKELFELIDDLVLEPTRWELNKEAEKHRIEQLLEQYADRRQPTVEQLVKAMAEEYPALSNNVEILQVGLDLRKDILHQVFGKTNGEIDQKKEGETVEEVLEGEKFDVISVEGMKRLESKMILFERLLSLNNILSQQINYIAEGGAITKKGKKMELDAPGTAQAILSQKKHRT